MIQSIVTCLVSLAFLALQSDSFSVSSSWCVDAISVEAQLGYLPPNFHSVSARTVYGTPIAIQTYPLQGGAPRRQEKQQASSMSSLGTPFPTLFWLTNPDISKAISDLERRGYVSIFQEKLNQDKDNAKQFIVCHEDYARRRWECISANDQALLLNDVNSSIQRMRSMMMKSGIAGTDFRSQVQADGSFRASMKCLHAHYGHFRSVNNELGWNPVGCWVHELLQKEYPTLIL